MRTSLIALGILLAGTAFAQSGASDDDEKPGSRTASPKKSTPDESDDSPPPRAPAAPSAEGGVEKTTEPAAVAAKPSKDDDDDDDDDDDRPATTTKRRRGGQVRMDAHAHPEGDYAGVSIGGEGLPPRAPKKAAGPQRMTWPGFQMHDGVPTVFLQTTGAPSYTVSETPGALVVTLHGTRIQLRNNQRPLDVSAFDTTVTEVSAKPRGKDVVVTIRHKNDVAHHERVEPSAGGYQLLLVELPAR
jgi:hypothetical protein